ISRPLFRINLLPVFRPTPAQPTFRVTALLVSGHNPLATFGALSAGAGLLLFEAQRGRVIHVFGGFHERHERGKFFFGRALHTDKQATTLTLGGIPAFNMRTELLPTAQVEIANTEVGPL